LVGKRSKGVNPNRKSGVGFIRRPDVNLVISPTVSAAELVPEVLLLVPSDYATEAESWTLTTEQLRVSIHIVQTCAVLKRTVECHRSVVIRHGREHAVRSSKHNPIGDGTDARGYRTMRSGLSIDLQKITDLRKY